jgi:hypothetical protein
VITQAAHGTSREGFDAEWRVIVISIVEGSLYSRVEVFDETDLHAALARFEELQPRPPRLQNAASRAEDRFFEYFGTRDWAAMAEILSDGSTLDHRSRVVNVGFWSGRDAIIANQRSLANAVSPENIMLTVIATRGERLALTRMHSPSNRDPQNGEFVSEMLIVAEIDSDGKISAHVGFDGDDIDAAFAELDARYVAGEAAAYEETWSVISSGHASFNRHKLPATTPNFANIDRRRGRSFEPGDMIPYIQATWDVAPGAKAYIETVHRLSELGAVITQTTRGISEGGFDAEWRMVDIFTVEDERISRVEIFDETDLDAALARFDELQPEAPRLQNAATKVEQRFIACFANRDWSAMAELLSDDTAMDDRRRVVNGGIRRGRDAEIASEQAVADVGVTKYTQTMIAIRGGRLALSRYSISDGWSGTTVLCVSEINAENQIAARVVFDPEDVDAAFEELESRYVAGEGAAHARTWSVIARACKAFNSHEVPSTTKGAVAIEHRPLLATETADLAASIRAVWDFTPDAHMVIEAVHQLSELGGVVTYVLKGTSPEGFDAEWRMVDIFTVEGDQLSICEVFDEADLGAALARFSELHRPAPSLENAATQARLCIVDAFNSRDVDGLLALATPDARYDDRRMGLRDEGLAARRELVRGIFEAPRGWRLEVTPLAVRGSCLALTHDIYRDTGHADRPITNEHLMLTEVNADGLVHNSVIFDPDDIDAAFEELEARYLAGEATSHAGVWSLVTRRYAALNRHELPPDRIDVNDHRRIAMVEPGDPGAVLRAGWDLTPNFRIQIEAVHRLGVVGAVVSRVTKATTEEGFAAEWRAVDLWTLEGDRINGCELFDETDLDAALARFDELDAATPT